MDEQSAEVLGILLDPVIERLDLLLLQEPEHVLLELARPLARDNLDERRFLPHGLVHDVAERLVDVVPAVIDIVQVELELHLAISDPPLPSRYAAQRDVPTRRPARGDRGGPAPELLTQARGTIGCAKVPPPFPQPPVIVGARLRTSSPGCGCLPSPWETTCAPPGPRPPLPARSCWPLRCAGAVPPGPAPWPGFSSVLGSASLPSLRA